MILRSNIRELCIYLKLGAHYMAEAGVPKTSAHALSTVAKAMRLVETPYV